ncbi:MAG: hypothetical protein HWE10_12475 [Gammaproteobacteria bacterium]|nr:hypothetical protein [Gammaproteobacteria bacterium]
MNWNRPLSLNFVAVLFLILISFSQAVIAGQLTVGFAEVDITPRASVDVVPTIAAGDKLVSQVSDKLKIKALVLSDEKHRIAIISADLIWIQPKLQQSIIQASKEQWGFDHVLLSVTHTHSGVYHLSKSKSLKRNFLEALQHAQTQLVPVKIGSSSVQINESYNRIQNKNGKAEMLWRNKSRTASLPSEQSLEVIHFKKLNDNPYLTLVSYNAHPVITMDLNNVVVSADYPGEISKYLQSHNLGDSMFLLGAAGDVNPYDADSKPLSRALENSRKLGTILGNKVREVIKTINDFKSASEFHFSTVSFSNPSAEIGVLKFTNEIALAHFPGEYFSDFAFRLKQASAYRTTLFVSMTNGYLGYVPTNQALKIGGYGTRAKEGVAKPNIGKEHVNFAIKQLSEK